MDEGVAAGKKEEKSWERGGLLLLCFLHEQQEGNKDGRVHT
jgi:hypothetical protein